MKDGYKDIIEALIKKQSNLIGLSMAISKAHKVNGISIDDNGRVIDIRGDGKTVLGGIVKEYSFLSGDFGISFCRKVVGPFAKKNPTLKLPDILK